MLISEAFPLLLSLKPSKLYLVRVQIWDGFVGPDVCGLGALWQATMSDGNP